MKQRTNFFTKNIIASVQLLSIELVIVLMAFISSLLTIVFFIRLIFVKKEQGFDQYVFTLLDPYVGTTATAVMNFFTFFGSQYFLIPANLALIIYSFFIKKNKWFAIRILSVSISSLVVMFFLKYLFQRPRPLIPLLREVPGLSFPSGHAFMSFAFFGLLIYMTYKKIQPRWFKYSLMLFFFLFTSFIGLSRIYLRVHYASDVIAGFCLSLMWLIISLFVIRQIEKYKTKMPSIQ